jgi:hypothetical protein
MNYEGKSFGANVSHGGAGVAQEIASNKPHLESEHVKHGASVGAEHQSVRGATQVPQEVEIKPLGPRLDDGSLHQAEHQPVRGGQAHTAQELTPEQRSAQIFQADQELAARHPEEVARIAADTANANHKLFLANRGLLGDLFHKLGISNYYNIYDQPMSKWDELIGAEPRIAQDVQQAHGVNISNESWKKLNDIKSMLGHYDTNGRMKIEDCLRMAGADPRIGVTRGSIGAEIQMAINETLNNKK